MPVLSVAFRKLRSLTTFSLFEIALIIPVFVALGCARLAIAFRPFRTYARHMGTQNALDTKPPELSATDLKRAKSIGRVVRSTAKITPWASLCLAQALSVSFFLRLARLPYCVVFGVAARSDVEEQDPLAAHAWVLCGDIALTGGHGLARYTVVMVFKSDPAGAA